MDYSELHAAVLRGDAQSVSKGVEASLKAGTAAADILDSGLVPPMIEIGELFEAGEVYVPEMLIAAHAMKAGMQILRPELVKAGVEPIGKVAIGTVQGDIHDIGKNLVAMMMEGAGIEVIDLGVDVSSEEFVEAVKDGVDVLGMSGLLTTTIPAMPRVLQAIEEAGIRDQVKVMVGGAPVTESFAADIGADGYAPDAASAVRVAKSFLTG
jgi:5-methyltetrahydrofolate--homocysteine methyltransferase